jgi:carboxymethylenebutenolidase
MCEKDDFDEMYAISRARDLSRRQFGALTLGVGLTAMLPRPADAAETTESEVEIKTPDGTCDAYLVHPVKGRYPAVLIWPDICGPPSDRWESASRNPATPCW